ncbi:MAG: hypothetical protein JO060_00025 [Candidatus Eremiobacteraeota bacterium]|nr:hypothetical protein [Candidatus Eremiobacteraeota bacterium]
MADDADALDGNAVAGELREIFIREITAASAKCNGCGKVAMLAEARAYTRAPGAVLRCSACAAVLVRLVRGKGHAWLDMRGLSYVQLAVPDPGGVDRRSDAAGRSADE